MTNPTTHRLILKKTMKPGDKKRLQVLAVHGKKEKNGKYGVFVTYDYDMREDMQDYYHSASEFEQFKSKFPLREAKEGDILHVEMDNRGYLQWYKA